MSDVVNKLMEDNPEMIRDWGSAWGRLIEQKIVRILSRRKPFLYELTYANSSFF